MADKNLPFSYMKIAQIYVLLHRCPYWKWSHQDAIVVITDGTGGCYKYNGLSFDAFLDVIV